MFSPPAWGWSVDPVAAVTGDHVLPTRVGMVRSTRASRPGAAGSPHPRGDGPDRGHQGSRGRLFSPPAWGWSGQRGQRSPRNRVLPTRVGMVRLTTARTLPKVGSPHPRGDGPVKEANALLETAFSPPAWGWSAGIDAALAEGIVLPTRVGMVRTPSPSGPSCNCSPHPRGDGLCATHGFRFFGRASYAPASTGNRKRAPRRPYRCATAPVVRGRLRVRTSCRRRSRCARPCLPGSRR